MGFEFIATFSYWCCIWQF